MESGSIVMMSVQVFSTLRSVITYLIIPLLFFLIVRVEI